MGIQPYIRVARGIAAISALVCLGGLTAGSAVVSAEPDTRPAATRTASAATRPATAPADDPAVEGLLAELSAASWRTRDRAVGRLADLGEAVEEQVRRFARDARGDEARDRARLVLARLAAERRLGPTRVTLHLRDATAQAAFAELSRQGGLFIRARRESLWRERDFAPLTLDLTDAPFWEATKVVCARTGMRPMFEGGQRGDALQLILVPDVTGEMAGPHATHGPVTVLVDSLTRRPAPEADPAAGRNPPAGGNPAAGDGDAELRLSFFADPRWQVTDRPGTATVTAFDNAGKPLPAGDPLTLQPYLEGSPRWAMRGLLKKVPTGGKRLSQVSGVATLTAAELSPPAVVENVTKATNVVTRCGPHVLHLIRVDQEDRRYIVQALFTRGGGGNAPTLSTEAVADAIWLVDPAGRPLRRSYFDAPDNGGQVRLTLNYEAAAYDSPPPARLVWRVPVATREITVRFTVPDVPIAD